MMKDFLIRSQTDLMDVIEEYGFLPFFGNSIEGFSVEEHIDPSCWYHYETDSWPAWEWKGPVIRESGCAYGKFFEKKACYISREWFFDFANYRRDGYDFDARWDDGLVPRQDKRLYDLIAPNAPIISKDLKKLGDYRKGGVKGFDTCMNRLQAQCYVLISDFVYMKNKRGETYGWGVAEYSTPEALMGSAFCDAVYRRSPEESYERITEHFCDMFPDESLDKLKRFIR